MPAAQVAGAVAPENLTGQLGGVLALGVQADCPSRSAGPRRGSLRLTGPIAITTAVAAPNATNRALRILPVASSPTIRVMSL
ncbi:hypothetical protein GCM10010331_77520 [Streptomyces xanthochromogenes]|nr:hypothetical protein GCM10010331_77520 [Streptomyces xanthochromogenes]